MTTTTPAPAATTARDFPLIPTVRERLGSATALGTFLAVIALIGPLYLLTTNWDGVQINDTHATITPAHRLATAGTLDLDQDADTNLWFVQVGDAVRSNRFIGTILHAVPAYWFSSSDTVTPEPGAAASAIIATLGVGVIALVLRQVTTPWRAFVGAVIAGLATSTWGISSAAMWTHTPGQLWLAVGVLATSYERYLSAGGAFAVALLCRPQNAVSAAVIGLHRAWRERSARPALAIGAVTALGAAAFLAYNRWAFPAMVDASRETGALTGGYGDGPLRSLVSMPLDRYAENIAAALFSPTRGLFFASPFVLVLLLAGGRKAWRVAPVWVRSAALAAVAYLLVQLRVNGFDGGADFLVYRLPLESLTLAAPLLLLAYEEGVAGRRGWITAFWTTTAISVAVQTTAATVWVLPGLYNHETPGWEPKEWQTALTWLGPTRAAAMAGLITVIGMVTWRVNATVEGAGQREEPPT